MQSDIYPSEMSLAELIDHLQIRDARVVRKILEAIVDWKMSFPRAIVSINTYWKTSGYYDKAEFEGFERAIDEWIETGRRYG